MLFQLDSTQHLRERWAGLFDGGSIENFNVLLDEDARDDTVGRSSPRVSHIFIICLFYFEASCV